jgi:hypothetical protein
MGFEKKSNLKGLSKKVIDVPNLNENEKIFFLKYLMSLEMQNYLSPRVNKLNKALYKFTKNYEFSQKR